MLSVRVGISINDFPEIHQILHPRRLAQAISRNGMTANVKEKDI
jgi:hypothetical protein